MVCNIPFIVVVVCNIPFTVVVVCIHVVHVQSNFEEPKVNRFLRQSGIKMIDLYFMQSSGSASASGSSGQLVIRDNACLRYFNILS